MTALKLVATLGLATSLSLPVFAQAGPPRSGYTAPYEHGQTRPNNDELPNPYVKKDRFGTLPDRRPWGSVTAMDTSPDGAHIWVAERCGANSCIGSTVSPIVKFDQEGKPLTAFGRNMFAWPHGMDVDDDGNVWVTDARGATAAELEQFPSETNKGHAVFKFSPDGKLLMTIGTPGTAGLPPQSLSEPNDVLIAPDGHIFISEGHRAQFVDGANSDSPDAFGRISKYTPDGTFIKSFGAFGYVHGAFRTPHALAMDSEGRILISDRGNRRIQFFSQDGKYLGHTYEFSRTSGLYVDSDDKLYAVDSESSPKYNPGWSKGLRIGNLKSETVTAYIPPHDIKGEVGLGGPGAMGEGITVDKDGNIYVGEIGPVELRGVTRYMRE